MKMHGLRKTGSATQIYVTHKSQEQLAKFIAFQIGETNDKRAKTIPTLYRNLCLFLAVTLSGFFSQHIEQNGRRI